MNVLQSQRFCLYGRSSRRSLTARLHVELLESRTLPAAPTGPASLAPATDPGSVVEPAQNAAALPPSVTAITSQQDSVTVTGVFQSETADSFPFQVGQEGTYFIQVNSPLPGQAVPAGSWLGVTDTATNQAQYLLAQGTGTGPASQVNATGQIDVLVMLAPGTTDIVRLTRWSADAAYQLRIAKGPFEPGSPQPLSVGSAPAIAIRLLDAGGTLPSSPVTSTSAPVSASNIVPASSGTAPSAPPPLAIPASVFVALSAGPVGAVNAAPGTNAGSPRDVYDRVYGQGPVLAYSERLLGLAILTQVGPTANVTPTDPSTASAASGQNAPGWWQSLLMAAQELRLPQANGVAPVKTLASQGPAPEASSEEEEEEPLLEDQAFAPNPAGSLDLAEAAPAEWTPPLRGGRDTADRMTTALAVSAVFAAWGNHDRRQRRPDLRALAR